MRFYQQDEVNELYKQMKNKRYSDKEEWEKFLDKDSTRMKRKKKLIKDKERPLYDY